MGCLEGKVAFVTGAARGQGRAHAVTLAHEGADIIAVDTAREIESVHYPQSTKADLDQTAAEVEALDRRAISSLADVRSQDELDAVTAQAIDEFGQIDILIANAGIFGVGSFWELTDEEWRELIDINLSGIWRSAKAIAPHMIERRKGAIVMTASVNGLEGSSIYAHYVAAKHGVIGLMQCVALELAPYGIRCNAVCPGTIDTQMVNWPGTYNLFAGTESGTREDLIAGAKNFHALAGANVLSPQTIADAALWLVSDGAAAVTGVALPVDAGHMIHEPVD
jgi:SDR family mycofactocin-dependent oxidoreductase